VVLGFKALGDGAPYDPHLPHISQKYISYIFGVVIWLIGRFGADR
jgi:hypothetical protein